MTKEIIRSILADVQMEPAVQGDIWDFLSMASNYILIISALLAAPLLYLLAVFYLLTAAGEIEKISRAKKLFLWTTVGLVVILIARGFFAYLAQIF
jgi:hypothetical protein